MKVKKLLLVCSLLLSGGVMIASAEAIKAFKDEK